MLMLTNVSASSALPRFVTSQTDVTTEICCLKRVCSDFPKPKEKVREECGLGPQSWFASPLNTKGCFHWVKWYLVISYLTSHYLELLQLHQQTLLVGQEVEGERSKMCKFSPDDWLVSTKRLATNVEWHSS